jgi:hypothetical protein
MKRIKLRDNTLKWTIYIYINYTYSKYCDEIWIEFENKEWLLWQSNNIDWISYIFIKDKKDLPTIVHELLHSVNYILWYKWIEIEEELQCYYQEYFFREYLRQIKARK